MENQMKYSNLTKTQKEFVNGAISVVPALAEMVEVTRAQLKNAYVLLEAQRTPTSRKIGYPLWLANNHKTGRGSYVWPAPTAADLVADSLIVVAQKTKKVNTTQTQEARARLEKIMQPKVADTIHTEFMEELRVAGIVEV
jgi:hypothetical protein